jgi:hypothetical protein
MAPDRLLASLLLGGTITFGFLPPAATEVEYSNELLTAFGRSVAVAGDFAFVGEPNVGGGGGRGGRGAGTASGGVVHIFRFTNATGWRKVDSLMSSACCDFKTIGCVVHV